MQQTSPGFGILLFVRKFGLLVGIFVAAVLLCGLSTSAQTQSSAATQSSVPPIPARAALNVVVVDPAHGGIDAGGRGTEGIRESDVVLEFASQLKKALEAQGFQVVQTRDGNDNPSFDDRSARANAQRGAIFISLHVGSTGVIGTARVYVSREFAAVTDTTGLIPWDRAQAPFVSLSHKLGDLVQIELAKRFKGSPSAALVAPVRQLRTTAAPAIAVEISSVSVRDRADLDRMVPGIADAIARGVVAFRPSYVIPTLPSAAGGVQP
jgi:N-acetylmuramoyl-L-alanine amidase